MDLISINKAADLLEKDRQKLMLQALPGTNDDEAT
jgi:hypothetical protein